MLRLACVSPLMLEDLARSPLGVQSACTEIVQRLRRGSHCGSQGKLMFMSRLYLFPEPRTGSTAT